MPTYAGGCHCGEVRFEIRTEAPIDRFVECDCSICRMKGMLHLACTDENFTLLSGERSLSLYRFHSREAKHWFCKRCGIHAFGRPRTAPERYTINVRCLDDYEALAAGASLGHFDGRNHFKDRAAPAE